MVLLDVMKVRQQEGSFLLLNAGLLAGAEPDYTKYKERTNKEKVQEVSITHLWSLCAFMKMVASNV